MPESLSEMVGRVGMPDPGRETRGVALALHPDPCHGDVREAVQHRRREG